jgi:hypothetical protein
MEKTFHGNNIQAQTNHWSRPTATGAVENNIME